MRAYGKKREWAELELLRKNGDKKKKATRFWKKRARQTSKKITERGLSKECSTSNSI